MTNSLCQPDSLWPDQLAEVVELNKENVSTQHRVKYWWLLLSWSLELARAGGHSKALLFAFVKAKIMATLKRPICAGRNDSLETIIILSINSFSVIAYKLTSHLFRVGVIWKKDRALVEVHSHSHLRAGQIMGKTKTFGPRGSLTVS